MSKSRITPQKTDLRSRPPRGSTRFKQSETARLVRGAQAAGLVVRGIQADDATGRITVLVETGKGEPGNTGKSDDRNEWDDVQ